MEIIGGIFLVANPCARQRQNLMLIQQPLR